MEMFFFFFAVGDSKHSDIASLLELELQKTSLLYQGPCVYHNYIPFLLRQIIECVARVIRFFHSMVPAGPTCKFDIP